MKENRVVITLGGRMMFIGLENITYIEVQDHRLLIHLTGDSMRAAGTLSAAEKKLYGRGFVRINRSYLVSIDHIKEIADGWIVLDDLEQTEIPVGISYEKNLYDEIKKCNYLFL